MKSGSSGTPSARWGDDNRARHAIAEELARHGEPPATQDELLRLQHDELLNAAEQGEVPYSELAATIREWRHGRSSGDEVIRERGDGADTDEHTAAPETGPRNRQPLMIPLGGTLPDEPRLARQHAVSRVLAASVSEDLAIWERIVRFRLQQLGGSLLAWVAVDRWVTDHGVSARSHAPSYWLSEVPVSLEQLDRGAKDAPVGYTTLSLKVTAPLPSHRESHDEHTLGVGRLEPKALKYLRPGDVNPTWRYVAAGSVLDDLRRLSEELAPVDLFDRDADMTLRPWWTRAQATTFALTGLALHRNVWDDDTPR